MEVTLLNPKLVSNLIKLHGETASICYNTNKKYSEKVGESCLKSGHMSGSRGDYIKFEISGISRYTADQLVRHEQGVFKNMQSQRYVLDNFEYTTPSIIKNNEFLYEKWQMAMEDIQLAKEYMTRAISEELPQLNGEQLNEITRSFNPMAIHTKLVIGFTIEAFIHLCHKRLCTRAQEEIRLLVNQMKNLVLAIEPRYEDKLVPHCEYLLWCPEGDKCCGKMKTKDELLDKIYNSQEV